MAIEMSVKRLADGSETWTSATACSSAEIKYLATNVTSKAAAIAAVFSDAPESYGGGLVRKSVRVDSYKDGVMELSAVYGGSSGGGGGLSGDDVQVSFDTSGGTRRVNIALSETCYDVEQGGHSSMSNPVINWNGKTGAESKVDGVDVPSANPRLTFSKLFSASSLTTSYQRKLMQLTGTVNNKKWRGWEKGELLFLGANYSGKTEGSVQVTFSFQVMPNESNAKIAGHSIGKKEGWQYVWTRSRTVKGSDDAPEVKVTHIYKADVLKKSNFSELGI